MLSLRGVVAQVELCEVLEMIELQLVAVLVKTGSAGELAHHILRQLVLGVAQHSIRYSSNTHVCHASCIHGLHARVHRSLDRKRWNKV